MHRDSETQHGSAAPLQSSVVLLHWFLAAAVIFLFVSSWWMLSLPLPSENFTYRELPFQLHKNIGLSLFLAAMLMFALRVRALLQEVRSQQTWLQRLAVWDHLLLYGLLALCCLSGYLSSSYSGWATSLWWLIELPQWAQEDEARNILYSDIHMWSCWMLLGLLLLHVAAAIYHAFGSGGESDKMFRLPGSNE